MKAEAKPTGEPRPSFPLTALLSETLEQVETALTIIRAKQFAENGDSAAVRSVNRSQPGLSSLSLNSIPDEFLLTQILGCFYDSARERLLSKGISFPFSWVVVSNPSQLPFLRAFLNYRRTTYSSDPEADTAFELILSVIAFIGQSDRQPAAAYLRLIKVTTLAAQLSAFQLEQSSNIESKGKGPKRKRKNDGFDDVMVDASIYYAREHGGPLSGPMNLIDYMRDEVLRSRAGKVPCPFDLAGPILSASREGFALSTGKIIHPSAFRERYKRLNRRELIQKLPWPQER